MRKVLGIENSLKTVQKTLIEVKLYSQTCLTENCKNVSDQMPLLCHLINNFSV